MNASLVGELRRIVGADSVFSNPLEVLTYECDALTHLRRTPLAVVLPSSALEVQEVVRLCRRARVPLPQSGA